MEFVDETEPLTGPPASPDNGQAVRVVARLAGPDDPDGAAPVRVAAFNACT